MLCLCLSCCWIPNLLSCHVCILRVYVILHNIIGSQADWSGYHASCRRWWSSRHMCCMRCCMRCCVRCMRCCMTWQVVTVQDRSRSLTYCVLHEMLYEMLCDWQVVTVQDQSRSLTCWVFHKMLYEMLYDWQVVTVQDQSRSLTCWVFHKMLYEMLYDWQVVTVQDQSRSLTYCAIDHVHISSPTLFHRLSLLSRSRYVVSGWVFCDTTVLFQLWFFSFS